MTESEFNNVEQTALDVASMQAGKYLEGLGKYNLAELSREEWYTFLGTVVKNFTHQVREAERLRSPF